MLRGKYGHARTCQNRSLVAREGKRDKRATYTRERPARSIGEVVTATGGSIERVFRRAELPMRLMESPDTLLLPLRDHFRLLTTASREPRDQAFAASLGRRTAIAGLAVYGKWVAQAPTLSEAIHRAATIQPHMMQSAVRLVVRRQGKGVHWSCELAGPATEGRSQNEMLAIWYMIAIVRHFAGIGWRSARSTRSAFTR
jgi:hypothetical protein